MVVELHMNHTTEIIYSSAFHNVLRLQVSFIVVAFDFIQYQQQQQQNHLTASFPGNLGKPVPER